MNIEELRNICLKVAGVEETQPFGPDNLVYKIMGNMFALIDLNRPNIITLKCNPDKALELRDRYVGIEAAWHFNKKYWNQIDTSNNIHDTLLLELINHSVDEVVKKWSKKKQLEYAQIKNAQL